MFSGTKLRTVNIFEKTTFAYINPRYSLNSGQSHCIQFYHNNIPIILWVVYTNSVAEGTIGINSVYRRLLGLIEDIEVFVSTIDGVNILDQLNIEPDSSDDQEILEQNAQLLQTKILDQLRVVVENQKTLVWLYSSMPIIFTPKQTGILVNHSQVIVKIDNFIFKPDNKINFKNIPNKSLTFNNVGQIIDELLNKYEKNIKTKQILRTLTVNRLSTSKVKSCNFYQVHVVKSIIPCEFIDKNVIFAILYYNTEFNTNEKENQSEINEASNNIKEILVTIIPIDEIEYYNISEEHFNSCIPTALVTKQISDALSIENGRKVTLEYITNMNKYSQSPDSLEIEVYSNKNDECVVNNIKEFILKLKENYIVNSGMYLFEEVISRNEFKINIKPNKVKYCIVNAENLRDFSINVKYNNEVRHRDINREKISYESKEYCRNISSIEQLVNKCKLYLEFEKQKEAIYYPVSTVKGNIIITGASGSGKSSLCEIISHELIVWSQIIKCRPLKGRKDIPDVLDKVLLSCKRHSPSVLFCDDIDALVLANTEGAAPQDIEYYNRLAIIIKKLLKSCLGVTVVMTATSMKDLHQILREFDSLPLYMTNIKMNNLNENEREILLNHLINERVKRVFTIEGDDIKQLSVHTNGLTIRQIKDYFNKLIFAAVKTMVDGSIKPRLIVKPIDVGQQDPFEVFSQIGGMNEVKGNLIEKIFWPILYPRLFESQSCGILLFGPPGMGKTYIGSCLAKLTNMSFISVKGPELLSKYIGQSEKAVRDIFDKADSKNPCILFFDEFDSIAPKRGHDSTGVTDRVVNQFLARLDGAEGGAKGPVIAASSRPDLIDPALLRPGRLDQHLYCPPPSESDRHDILMKIACEMDLSDNVDLKVLAESTEGYSPADLKSVLVTAQLTAVDRCIENLSEVDKVTVLSSDIEAALAETKPSLSQEQLAYYNVIYKRFRGDRLSDGDRMILGPQQQKVTLA